MSTQHLKVDNDLDLLYEFDSYIEENKDSIKFVLEFKDEISGLDEQINKPRRSSFILKLT